MPPCQPGNGWAGSSLLTLPVYKNMAHCLHRFQSQASAERVSFYYFKRDSTERAKHALFGIIQLPFILSINKYLLSFQTMVYSVHFAFNFHLSQFVGR